MLVEMVFTDTSVSGQFDKRGPLLVNLSPCVHTHTINTELEFGMKSFDQGRSLRVNAGGERCGEVSGTFIKTLLCFGWNLT